MLGDRRAGDRCNGRDAGRAGGQAGSLDALGELRSTDGLSDDAIAGLIEQLSDKVTHQVSEAHSGRYGYGEPDVGRTLVMLNVWHPAQANWEPIFALLPDPAVAPDHKHGALHALANLTGRLSEEVRAQVAPIARSLSAAPSSAITGWLGPPHSINGVAAHLWRPSLQPETAMHLRLPVCGSAWQTLALGYRS